MRITDLLRTIDLFEKLSSEELNELSHRMQDRHLRPGEILCRQGGPADAMFIVLGGSIELLTAGTDGRASSTRQLTAGEAVGELALISGEPHAFTAIAAAETRVLELHKDDFGAVVSTRPQLMRTMLASISRRAVQANRQLLTDQPSGAQAASNGRVYPVFSTRGGAGKTTLATSLAIRLAELVPQRVALLDLDLLFDDSALQLDLSPTSSLASISEQDLQRLDPTVLSSYLCEHKSSLRVLAGATSPEEGERVTVSHVRAALAAMKRQFLVTVVDCGGSLAEPTLAALELGDRVFVVCTPELLSLRDVRDCQRVFGHALHLDKTRVSYLFNHPLPSVGLTRLQFETALEQPMALEIPHAGDGATKPVFAKAIDQLARELRPTEAGTDGLVAVGSAGTPRASGGGNGLLRLLRGSHDRKHH